ncbi:mitochondrial small ribosomal subunit Rsm22-domain-containing protein [Scleroderma yunnanense]
MIYCTSTSVRILSRVARQSVCALSSSATTRGAHPNPPVTLDPTLKTLLEGVDLSVSSHKKKAEGELHSQPLRELEPFQDDNGDVAYYNNIDEEGDAFMEPTQHREDRKSPAARFGGNSIGSVVLPPELQRAIISLINDSDKSQLHSDAKRLFLSEAGSELGWDTIYDVKYKSRKQTYRHAQRDATAFASVILPAHYSAIFAVFHHVKHRLGATWNVQRVIDWGSGTGTGLWYALDALQKGPVREGGGPFMANSSVVSYLGIDKRDGLVAIGKKLLQGLDLNSFNVTWQKSFHESDRIDRSQGQNTLALSAFLLSSLPTHLSKKKMVKEMWESGAHTIILIDFNTKVGFENIAEARQLLLDLGRKDQSDPASQHLSLRGSHVVAPCPHDRPCPLYSPGASRLICGFSQRLQRPTFLRHTKHVRDGHEDMGYSYVVVQRGLWPDAMAEPVGRIGAVGKDAMERQALTHSAVLQVLEHADERQHNPQSPSLVTSQSQHFQGAEDKSADEGLPQLQSDIRSSLSSGAERHAPVHEQVYVSDADAIDAAKATSLPHGDVNTPLNPVRAQTLQPMAATDLEEALRREAYGWPRLVFPPLKRSGHIIIDACTPEGKIMRLTIPKSQGKQPFYDARKSSWGDLFPHPSKNKPVERFQSTSANVKSGPVRGDDIGKRAKGRDKHKVEEKSYEVMEAKIRKEQWKANRRVLAAEKRLAQDTSAPH